ncbi:MAG: methionyl-tRNA formyltransferase [Brachymonas sp.]|nr:methionyl-tRNA formyltransferase [Brachymonas sp.]
MRVAFAGTPAFAQQALSAMVAAGLDVPLVLTQPDRPAGRGMQLQASPVKQIALAHGLAVLQPRSLRLDGKYPEDAAAAQQALLAAQPDIMVVAAYGLILPQWVLDLPVHGCINIHASLLPRWRGAAPIHRAIEAGDTTSGITIMQMDAGLDTGDMLLQETLPIAADDTTATLHDKLAAQGAQLVLLALEQVRSKTLAATPQPAEGVTYAHKIEKAEALLDWMQPAAVLERRVRAFTPFPGASTRMPAAKGGEEHIKIWQAAVSGLSRPALAQAGEVIAIDAAGIHIACGSATADGVLCAQTLQRPGGKALAAADWLRGFALSVGTVLAAK